MSGHLRHEHDTSSLHELFMYVNAAERRCRWWQWRRKHRLHVTFWVVAAVLEELRARGELRNPTMFSDADDATVVPVRFLRRGA